MFRDPACFMPRDDYYAEIDGFVASVRQLAPFPGLDEAALPGGMEAARRQQASAPLAEGGGIPLTRVHWEGMRDMAVELGVVVDGTDFAEDKAPAVPAEAKL